MNSRTDGARIQLSVPLLLTFNLCVFTFTHQIVRINGSSATDDRVVILGAHQDRCVNSLFYLDSWNDRLHLVPTYGHSFLPLVCNALFVIPASE